MHKGLACLKAKESLRALTMGSTLNQRLPASRLIRERCQPESPYAARTHPLQRAWHWHGNLCSCKTEPPRPEIPARQPRRVKADPHPHFPFGR